MCSAFGNRASTAFCVATCSANTTSGSPDSRKSAIHASAVGSLPPAASWRRLLSRTSCSARRAAATSAARVRRSCGSAWGQVLTSRSPTRLQSLLEEVGNPRGRGGQLTAHRQLAEVVEPDELLAPQSGGDLRVQRPQLERKRLEPGDDVALRKPVLVLVREQHGHGVVALRGQLR